MSRRLTESDGMNDDKEEPSDIYREENHIYFQADIDRKTIAKLTTLLREADESCIILAHRLRIESVPIYLHLYSDGGVIFSAFSAIDVIQACKSPVYSVIEGATASAGTLISIACAKRYIRPLSYMLIHQLSSGCSGKMVELMDEHSNLTEMMKVMKVLYLKYTKLTPKKLDQLLSHDLWLDAKQCIALGLVDEMYV
jgi:ATP-dependent protease ClpP protease subunit